MPSGHYTKVEWTGVTNANTGYVNHKVQTIRDRNVITEV